jgi:hypothetical protein
MAEAVFSYRMSHIALRLIVIINFTHLVLGTFSIKYFQAVNRLPIGGADIYWFIASCLILPLYVALEVWWMLLKDNALRERKSLLIDAMFAVIWAMTFGIFLLYAWTHYAII